MAETLEELRATLKSMGPHSELNQQLNDMLIKLNGSLEYLQALASTLSRRPSAAILPQAAEPDPIPRAEK